MIFRTFWTPLGYHPSLLRDLTPRWFKFGHLLLVIAAVTWFNSREGSNPNLYKGLVILFMSLLPLGLILFNKKQNIGRKNTAILIVFLLIEVLLGGYYVFFRP